MYLKNQFIKEKLPNYKFNHKFTILLTYTFNC